MIKVNWKLFLKTLTIFLIGIFVIFAINTYINNQVNIRILAIQENNAKELADYKKQCENDKLNQENELKKQNAELINELEKTKILIEKLKKQNHYSNMVKNDINGFMKELDSVLGVKGKEK